MERTAQMATTKCHGADRPLSRKTGALRRDCRAPLRRFDPFHLRELRCGQREAVSAIQFRADALAHDHEQLAAQLP